MTQPPPPSSARALHSAAQSSVSPHPSPFGTPIVTLSDFPNLSLFVSVVLQPRSFPPHRLLANLFLSSLLLHFENVAFGALMLTISMSNHSSSFHLGAERFETLTPPRARSTSPFQRLRGFQFKSSTLPISEGPENRPCSSQSSLPSVAREDRHMVPPPLKPVSGVTYLGRSLGQGSREGSILKPSVYSRPQPRASEHTLQSSTPLQPQSKRDDTFLLQPAAYSPPKPSRPRFSEQFIPEQQFDLPPPNIPWHGGSMSSSSSAPVSPWSNQEVSPLTETLVPGSSNPNRRKSTFTDPYDFGLFAEALSGVGPGPMTDPTPHTDSSRPTPPRNSSTVSPISPEEASYFVSHPAGDARTGNSYPPPAVAAHALPAAPNFDVTPGFYGVEPSSHQPQGSETAEVSAAMLGMHLEDDGPREHDDELPDYEQSQREAADQARIKASKRAAELESRWAASAPHHMR